MVDFDDIATEKEIAEIRLLPIVFTLMLWGIYVLPHQPTDVVFHTNQLVWISVATTVLLATSFLPLFKRTAWRRNIVAVYQAIILPMTAVELFSHQYHPMFLLIYLFMVGLLAFIARYVRIRLLVFLLAATLIIVWHPAIAKIKGAQEQTWQTALILTVIWNVSLFVISLRVRERQQAQTRVYFSRIEQLLQQQKAYAEQLYIERLHLQNIVDNVDVYIALLDKNGIVLTINQPFLNYIAAHNVSTELIGKPLASFAFNKERRRVVEESIQAALQGQIAQSELYNDVLGRYLTLRYCPIKDPATGEIYGVGVYYRDVTETYKTQRQLRDSSRQLKAILDSMDQNVYLTDRQGRIINANKWAQEGKFGLKPAPAAGEPLVNNIEEPENRESYLRHHAEAVQGKTTVAEYYIDALKLWMQVKYMPAYEENGKIFGVLLTVANITANKQKEEVILKSLQQTKEAKAQVAAREAMYRQLLNASADQIALKDTRGNYLWTNRQFKEFYGEPTALDAETQTKEQAEDQEVLLRKESVVFEYWARNQNGENHLLRTIKAPIWNEDGKVDKIAVFATDITEENERIHTLEELLKAYQNLSEQEQEKARALAESQAMLKLLAENTTELIVLARADGRLQYISPSVTKLTGFGMNVMQERLWTDFFHPDDLESIQQIAEHINQNNPEYTIKHRIRTRSGRYVWLETIWKYLFDDKGNVIGIQTSSRDITERMAAEQAMQALLTRYQTLFNASYDAILILKTHPSEITNLTVVEANTTAQELLGYTPEELQVISLQAIEEKISWQELRRRIKAFAEEREILIETRVRKKTGEMLWVEIAVVPFQIEREDYLQLTIRDISARRQAEEAIKAKAIAEKSLEFKTMFLAKMSHEIRTPMNGLLGMTYMLLSTALDERQKKIVESIQQSSKGLLAILNDVLDLSKLEAGKLTLDLAPMDLRRCIAEVHDLFTAVALEKNLTLSYVIAQDIPPAIVADYNRLRQVINNLVSNAIKFTDKGAVTITAELAAKQEDYDLLKITVRDTGRGISTDSFERLFEKFYQGEESRGMGTGLGLAICKELVQLMGGEIGLQSAPGKGSLFWFTLKAGRVQQVRLPDKGAPEKQAYQYRATRPIHILLAEDVQVNREVVKWMLEEIGAQVSLADNGLVAYELAQTTPYDVILMDINMPVMDGITATQRIKSALGAAPPIIGMSANAMAGDAERFMAQGMDGYLTKPITPEALYEVLYQFLPEIIERTLVPAETSIEVASVDLPLMNPSMIAHIKKLASNNVGMLQSLLESFILDIGQLRQKIVAAHQNNDHPEIVKALHTLKGLCGTIGATRLFEYANAVYSQASAAPHMVTAEQLSQLSNLIDDTANAVRREYLADLLIN